MLASVLIPQDGELSFTTGFMPRGGFMNTHIDYSKNEQTKLLCETTIRKPTWKLTEYQPCPLLPT